MYARYIKRWLDVVLVVLTAPVWLPLIAGIALLIRVVDGPPVLFRQQRPGLNGRPFTLFKFRSMVDRRDRNGRLLEDEQRLTRWGRWLRATSLDELPELWNVLRGEMSIVGPRPLLMEYLPLYTADQRRRHHVRPGLTGWGQIHGRNQVSWPKRFELDVWYVDHCSLAVDARILVKTLMQVAARRGVSATGHATMPRFTGTAADSRPTAHQRVASSDRGVWILGAGGHAKVVIRALQLSGVPIAGIYDDYQPNWGRHLLGVPILGPLADLERHGGARGVLAIGDCQVRQLLARRFTMNWTTVVHPTAFVDPTAEIAPGAVVLAGAIVQPCARIGAHAIINTAATVDHDSIVLDFAHLAPGVHLAGGVRVGRGTLMGIGSRAIPGVQIGDESIVGAGATVVSDLPAGVVAVGTPARVIKEPTISVA